MKWSRQKDREAEQEALAAAERDLAEVRARWPHIHALVATLRDHQRRNHFADAIAAVYAGRDK